jgi:RHS repeat-associated protein
MNAAAMRSGAVSGKQHRPSKRRWITIAVAALGAGALFAGAGAPRAQPRAVAPPAGPGSGAPVRGPDSQSPPAIASTTPAAEATGVSGRGPLIVRFTRRMALTSLSPQSVTLIGPAGAEPVQVLPADRGDLIYLWPDKELLPASRYTLFLSGVTDDVHRPLPLSAIGFDTAAKLAEDPVAPSSVGTAATDPARARPAAQGSPDQDLAAQRARLTPSERQAVVQAEAAGDPEDWMPGPQHFRGRWRADRAPSPLEALPPLQALPGVTALSGRVLGLHGHAVPGVTLRIGDRDVRTDVTGRFLLQGLPPGFAKLEIDGATADRAGARYGYYAARIELQPLQTTIVPYTIWMPRLDPAGTIRIAAPTTGETVLTSPRIPGLELHIPAGTVIRDRQGQIVTELNITAIPVDRPPFPVPDLRVPVYFTIQPGGAVLQSVTGKPSAGARLFYPNFNREVPGARGVFWNYDPDEREWFVYGMGTISADARQAIPNDGVVIHELTGAMFNGTNAPGPDGPPPCGVGACCSPGGSGPDGGGEDCDDSGNTRGWSNDSDAGAGACGLGGDPVSLFVGQFEHTERDLVLPDVMPLDITRTYRSLDKNQRAFGVGMTHAYDVFLFSQAQWQEVDLILPGGTRVHYARTSPGTGFTDAVFESSDPGQWQHSILARNNPRLGWDLTFRDGRKWFFRQFQPLSEIADRNGNLTRIVREADNGATGKVLRIVSPNGRRVDFTYNAAGFVSTLTDNLGRSFVYHYDDAGHLTEVVDPMGGTRRYTWDPANHRITAIHDPDGNAYVQNEYDTVGRIKKQTLSDGSVFLYDYTTQNGAVTRTDVTDRRGSVRRVQFDPTGYVVRNTYPLGHPEQQVTTYEVSNGNITASVDPLSRRTEYRYDAAGNTTRVTRLAGTGHAVSTSITYDPVFNLPLTITDANGNATTLSFDPRGNLIRVSNALGLATTFSYDGQGRRLTSTDPLGRVTILTYDGGDVSSVTYPLGRQLKYITDTAGRVMALIDALGNRSLYDWDDMNRMVGVTDPLGGLASFAFSASGNLISGTDLRGNTTHYRYNSLGKLQSIRDAESRDKTLRYDPSGQLQQLIDRNGQLMFVTRDALGRVKTVGFGATAANPTAYQSQIENTWDTANRLTQIIEKTCADPVGSPGCATVASSSVISRAYDDLDRMISEVTPQGEVNYAYDAAGRRTSMTIKNGPPGAQVAQPTITYTHDTINRLIGISQAAGTINAGQAQNITLAYDAASQRTQITLANGSTTSYTYNDAHEITALVYKKADGTVIGDLQYEYDANGHRTGVGGSLARLALPPADITDAAYDANNRLLTWNGKRFAYDSEGNLTSDGTSTYRWDERNRLRAIRNGATEVASFLYDGRGRRIGKTIGQETTGFLYDVDSIVQELQGTTNSAGVKAHLLNGGVDEVFLRLEGNDGANRQSLLADANHNTVMLLDAAQSSMVAYTYEPYGATTADAVHSNNRQFTGRENDNPGTDQGLYYYRARYYMPGTGRFMSEDPIGWVSGQMNNYLYVNANPATYRDPTGLSPGVGAGALAGCGIGGLAGPGGCAIGAGVGAAVAGVATAVAAIWAIFSAAANDNATDAANDNDSLFGRRRKCLPQYYVDTADCGSWYTNDSVYDACMDHARDNLFRCLNFQKRRPFP